MQYQFLSRRDKLIAAVRNNPKDVRFDDACWLAEQIGFTAKSRGATSHRAFARRGEPTLLNFQNRNSQIPPYQAWQLIEMLDKYEVER